VKLARVDHNRCDEIQASTYVWVSEDMGKGEFETRVNIAAKEYEAKLTAVRAAMPKRRLFGNGPDSAYLANNRALSVNDVIEKWKRERDEAKEQEKLQRAAEGSFASFLCDGENVQTFYGGQPEGMLTDEVYWGHRHGISIAYGSTDDELRDFVPIIGKKGGEQW